MVANDLKPFKKDSPEFAEIINAIPGSSIWIMKLSMMILPLICILIGFFLYQKKFKIDEKFYAQIVSDLEARNAKEQTKAEKVKK